MGNSVTWKHCLLRSAVVAAASADAALGALAPLLRRPRVQHLCFHHIATDRLNAFRHLLTILHRDHALIGYGQAINRTRDGLFAEPALALSFDDGFHSQLAAARALEEVGARGCFFVCPSIFDYPSRQATARFCRERLHCPPRRLMDWDDVAELMSRGHEIGCHSLSHANLAACSPQELDDQIGLAREAIVTRLGRADHFAWPWGRWQQVTPDVVRRVFEAGFATCASAEHGCHDVAHPDPQTLCIRRVVLDTIRRPQDALTLLALSASASGDGGWPNEWEQAARGGER